MGVRRVVVNNLSLLRSREAALSCVGELALRKNFAAYWIKFAVMLGLIKQIPQQMNMNSEAPCLAPLPAGSVFSRHCAALHHLLVRPQAADVLAGTHSIPKSMTIDLKEIPDRIHHVLCLEL